MSEPAFVLHKNQKPKTLFDDEQFSDQLVNLIIHDAQFLESVAPVLTVDDFKPIRGMQWDQQRWVVADRALTHYEKHQQPLGNLLHADIIEYANGLQLNPRQVGLLEDYLAHLKKIPLENAEAIAEKVTAFKLQRIKAATIDEMIELQASGELTDEKWMELTHKATANGNLRIDEACATGPSWPKPLGEAAVRGPLGKFVKLIEPHTEADPAALAIQLLVGFGNIVGRSPYYRVEATKHHMNMFAVVVGRTGKSRKGTSWDHVRAVLRDADTDWTATRVENGGLASGEGLIVLVRDSIVEKQPIREKGKIVGHQEVEIPGESDKRLLVIEPEFARVLGVCARESNTLSALIRQCWDTGELNNLTKHQRMSAHDAHISLIGHITAEELRRCITDTALANGFANRFLWVCAERSKFLPDGGQFELASAGDLLKKIQSSVAFARNVERMTLSDKARQLWHKIYPALSEGRPGLLGAVTSRAEAQVMRIACLYALLDSSPIVKVEHLQAAREVWRYCNESAQFIFGNALGDATADEILNELRRHSGGRTRNQIYDHFKRNKSSADIARALAVLAEHGLATMTKEKGPDHIRPTERWFAANGVKRVTK